MRSYAVMCKGIFQLQSSVSVCFFDIAFAITYFSFCGTLFKRILPWRIRHSQKVVFRIELFLSLSSFTCHIASIGVWKYVSNHVVIKIKTFQSCRSHVVHVALVSHSSPSCITCVALMSFVSHSYCSCYTRVTFVLLVLLVSHSWCSCLALVL